MRLLTPMELFDRTREEKYANLWEYLPEFVHANNMDSPELLPKGCTACHDLLLSKGGYVRREGF